MLVKQHWLHATDRVWPQSNCSVDLWIEVINSLGYNPVAAMAFTITLDYEGDQYTFFKIPQEDLEELFGLRLLELSVYDSVEKHVIQQVKRGNIVLVEVDAHNLPDTAGVAYGITHNKTTIGIDSIDPTSRSLTYFHNDIYATLIEPNYTAVLAKHGNLFPYCEFIKRVHIDIRSDQAIRNHAHDLLRKHVQRTPNVNPIAAFRQVFVAHLIELTEETFHEFAFNHFRMLGANFELFGAFVQWLYPDRLEILRNCKIIAENAKFMQFKAARAVARKRADRCEVLFDKIELAYIEIITSLNNLVGIR